MRKALKPYHGLLLLLPAVIILLIFRFYPLLYVFRVSFYKWGMGGPEKVVWFKNYETILRDHYFYQSLGNTLWYAVLVVPLSLFISLFFAILLNNKLKGIGFFRTSYFLPVVTSIVAISIIWKWIYHPDLGLANYILKMLHLHPLKWLSEWRGIFELIVGRSLPVGIKGPSLALFSLVLMAVWKGLGYNIIIFLAGLQNIPKEYYEAALIDGASSPTVFSRITWPMLTPTTFYVLIMTTIVSFQVFAPVWLMTGPPPGGPLGTTNVLVYSIFDNAFNFSRFGYASAVSMVLFLMILSLTVVQKKVIEPRVHYE
ncbi:sugar ABC transporter permease [candidate division WOR-3 bacterium]|nr:sugar ABC transporter permease [candidate division WOR-3 bacterium]